MAQVLDRYREEVIADEIISALDDAGYDIEEEIPGLVLALKRRANQSMAPDMLLDAAVDLLVEEEDT